MEVRVESVAHVAAHGTLERDGARDSAHQGCTMEGLPGDSTIAHGSTSFAKPLNAPTSPSPSCTMSTGLVAQSCGAWTANLAPAVISRIGPRLAGTCALKGMFSQYMGSL